MEVAGEGPSDLIRTRDRERLGDRRRPVEGAGRLLVIGLDRRETQALDILEEVVAAGFAQYLAEQDAAKAAEAAAAKAPTKNEVAEEADELLDEIDALLEEQSVLTNFRQKGGQ